MKIITKSGIVNVNKRSNYGKWLVGYTSTNAWTGGYTIERTWKNFSSKKPKGCSWRAWGEICGQIINPLQSASNGDKKLIRELKEDWDEIKTLIDKVGITLPKGLYIDKLEMFLE